MKKIIEMERETVEMLKRGKTVEGSLRWNPEVNGFVFRMYRRTCRRSTPQHRTLCETANGWLKESQERLKMHISVKKRAGKTCCAVAMLTESKEMAQMLYNMGIEEEDYV